MNVLMTHTLFRLSQELELKQHALALLKERMAGSESAQLAEAVGALEAELAAEEEAARAAEGAKERLVATAMVRRSYTPSLSLGPSVRVSCMSWVLTRNDSEDWRPKVDCTNDRPILTCYDEPGVTGLACAEAC